MHETILRLVEEGLSTYKIAVKIGKSQTWVTRYLKRYNLKTAVKPGPENSGKYDKYCFVCGNLKSSVYNKYCDSCISIKVYKRKSVDEYTTSTGRRNSLISKRGHICERCKTSQWMGDKVPLQVHHIDGNSDNNSEENLLLLCANCHMQTPNYSGKNIGNASNSKRSRYMKIYRAD